jgi:hypothetical protein
MPRVGQVTTKVCARCRERKILSEFRDTLNIAVLDGKDSWCRLCCSRYQKAYRKIDRAKLDKHQNRYKKDPRYRMWLSSKASAHTRGLEHTIEKIDIPMPTICKYLGITLDYRRASERGTLRADDAPSIDRIDNSRGYTPDNIQVISDLANKMKQNATSEQLIAFAEGVLRAHRPEISQNWVDNLLAIL